MSARIVLLRAAELIERDGLWKGGSKGPEGQRCTVRAIFDADASLSTEVLDIMRDALGCSVSTWSDARSTRQADVVAKLRAVAATL